MRAALESVCAANPRLRSYVLDDQGRVRHHVVVFIGGQRIKAGDAQRSGRRIRRSLRDAGALGRLMGKPSVSKSLTFRGTLLPVHVCAELQTELARI